MRRGKRRKGREWCERGAGKAVGAREWEGGGEGRERRRGGGEKETSELIFHHLDLAPEPDS